MGSQGPFGFLGGWNTKASPWTLPKDCLSDSQNIYISYGDLYKRNGSVVNNAAAMGSGAAVTGLYDWLAANGTRFFLKVCGSKIYQASNLASSQTDITSAATITGGQNNLHTFASLNNVVAICGGTTPDTPLQWSGSGNVSALSGSPPAGNIVAVANNFMFISGVAANPSRVYWSNVADPTTWGSSNYVDFRVSDGDTVTCIYAFNQNLFISKRRSIGILNTLTNTIAGAVTLAPLTQIPARTGVAGPLACGALPDGRLVFLGSDAHVYIFDGNGCNDISDPAPPASNIQPTLDTINGARLQYSSVKVYPTKSQVWISVSTGTSTTNNTIFVYNYQLNIWESQYPDIAANCLEVSIDPRSTPSHPQVLFTGNYSGFVYEQDIGSTNAENTDGHIDAYATVSVVFSPDAADFVPRSIVIPLEAQASGQLQVGWGFNGLKDISSTYLVSQQQGGALLDNNFLLDIATLAGSVTIRQVIPVYGTGRVYSQQIQFRNQQPSQPFAVHPIFISDEVYA